MQGETAPKGTPMSTQVLAPAMARLRVGDGLRRIAHARARLAALQAELDEELAGVHGRYDRRIAAMQGRVSRMHEELEQLCRAEKGVLFPGGRRTMSTPFGEVGFRRAEPVVRLRDGTTAEEACRRLREAGLDELVRTSEAPDKRAVHRALCEDRVSGEELRACGLELAGGGDRFQCRLRHDALDGFGRALA